MQRNPQDEIEQIAELLKIIDIRKNSVESLTSTINRRSPNIRPDDEIITKHMNANRELVKAQDELTRYLASCKEETRLAYNKVKNSPEFQLEADKIQRISELQAALPRAPRITPASAERAMHANREPAKPVKMREDIREKLEYLIHIDHFILFNYPTLARLFDDPEKQQRLLYEISDSINRGEATYAKKQDIADKYIEKLNNFVDINAPKEKNERKKVYQSGDREEKAQEKQKHQAASMAAKCIVELGGKVNNPHYADIVDSKRRVSDSNLYQSNNNQRHSATTSLSDPRDNKKNNRPK